MLEVVTKIHGQRMQRFQYGDQHQRQRERRNLPGVHLIADHLEEFQLGRTTVQAGIRPEKTFVQLQKATLRQNLTAERTLDVDDAVEAIADLFHLDRCFQLRPVKIVQTE